MRKLCGTPPKSLATLRGTLDDLLGAEEHSWAESAYCQITLTDAQRPAQAMEKVRTRFPDTLVLSFDPPQGAEARTSTSYSNRLAAAGDDLGVCCGFLEHVRDRGASDAEEAALQEALEAVRLQEAEL